MYVCVVAIVAVIYRQISSLILLCEMNKILIVFSHSSDFMHFLCKNLYMYYYVRVGHNS